jgi:hypothetical protein
MSLRRRVSFLGFAVLLAAAVVSAQSTRSPDPSPAQSSTTGYPSSQAGLSESGLQLAEFTLPDSAFPSSASSAGGGSAAGQYGGGSGKHGLFHNWAFEAGGGFNAPQSSSVTYGGNFTVGAGLKFSKYIAGLIEYQFMDDKLPGYLIAETGANGGYAHIWSFSFDPVIDLMPKASNGVYITGGGGFYRKVTSFTDPEEEEYCYYFCEVGVVPTVVGHFSSNQGGFSIGAGFVHRIGGMYGDSNTKLFVEARYLDVLSPASISNPSGLGTTAVAADTKVIPVTLGVRF